MVVILAGSAAVIFYDQRKNQRRQQQEQRFKSQIYGVGYPLGPGIFEHPPLEYAPARKLSAERPLEPTVGIAKPSWPPVRPRERETVAVQLASPFTSTLPAFTIDVALWESLIGSQPRQSLLPAANGNSEPASTVTFEAAYRMIRDDSPDTAPLNRPGGMMQQPELEEMLQRQELFTGLVVSIGINDSDSSMWHSQGLMQSVGNYMVTLLREQDFCCRTAYDEFVMLCRGEQGAQAQRRLNRISERLWDYQLRRFGSCSILFTWGGVQVQDQTLAEAIASANERMRETKRIGISARSHRRSV